MDNALSNNVAQQRFVTSPEHVSPRVSPNPLLAEAPLLFACGPNDLSSWQLLCFKHARAVICSQPLVISHNTEWHAADTNGSCVLAVECHGHNLLSFISSATGTDSSHQTQQPQDLSLYLLPSFPSLLRLEIFLHPAVQNQA